MVGARTHLVAAELVGGEVGVDPAESVRCNGVALGECAQIFRRDGVSAVGRAARSNARVGRPGTALVQPGLSALQEFDESCCVRGQRYQALAFAAAFRGLHACSVTGGI